jgi:general secretion pathway protein I
MKDDRGFTLIEVLVAFIIAALALAVLARAGMDGIRGATRSGRYQEALVRAQSHLAAIGDNPVPSDRQGDEGDGYHWRVRIAPIADSALGQTERRTLVVSLSGTASAPRPHVTLMAVSVAISWGGERHRSVELDSERVASSGAPSPP